MTSFLLLVSMMASAVGAMVLIGFLGISLVSVIGLRVSRNRPGKDH